jgi:hypothetical protein
LYTIAYPRIMLEKAEKWKAPVEKKEPLDNKTDDDDDSGNESPETLVPKSKPKKAPAKRGASKKFAKSAPKDLILPVIDTLKAEKLQTKNQNMDLAINHIYEFPF